MSSGRLAAVLVSSGRLAAVGGSSRHELALTHSLDRAVAARAAAGVGVAEPADAELVRRLVDEVRQEVLDDPDEGRAVLRGQAGERCFDDGLATGEDPPCCPPPLWRQTKCY